MTNPTNTAAADLATLDRATIVAKIREIGRALADETMSDADADALVSLRSKYQALLAE